MRAEGQWRVTARGVSRRGSAATIDSVKWTESHIRDELTADLSILESGLTLVGVEYHLPNSEGSRGYVDILCRDRFGRLVVVEIKRSDRTSREALHELHKYTELIQHHLGIGPADLRCLLVSTDWRELRRPFASFVRSTPYDSQGIELSIFDGALRAAPVFLPDAPRLIELKKVARLYCFYNQSDRGEALPVIAERLRSLGCDHFVAVDLDQSSSFPGMPFTLYVALGTVDALDPRTRELDALAEDVPEDDEWVPREAVWEERAFTALGIPPTCDELELGSPNKFRTMTSHEAWQVARIHRFGDLANREVHTDERLLDALGGGRGDDNSFFSRWGTPSHPTGWMMLRRDLARSLSGNDTWADPINGWLDEEARARPTEDFLVAVFNPMNFLRSLNAGQPALFDDTAPIVEVGAFKRRDSEGVTVRLHGEVVWDGTTRPDLVDTAHDVYGRDLGFWLAFPVEPEMDHEFLRQCGLTYALFEVDTVIRHRVSLVDGALQRSECDFKTVYDEDEDQVMVRPTWGSLRFFSEFVRERQVELLALQDEIRKKLIVIEPGST